MSPLEAIDPVMESPLAHPLLKQRSIAAELVTEVQQANTAVGGMLLANMEKSCEWNVEATQHLDTSHIDYNFPSWVPLHLVLPDQYATNGSFQLLCWPARLLAVQVWAKGPQVSAPIRPAHSPIYSPISFLDSLPDTLPPTHWICIARWLPFAGHRWFCPPTRWAASRSRRPRPPATLLACSRCDCSGSPSGIGFHHEKFNFNSAGFRGRRWRTIRKELALLDRSTDVVQVHLTKLCAYEIHLESLCL